MRSCSKRLDHLDAGDADQYTKDLQTLKSRAFVKYPLDVPFAACRRALDVLVRAHCGDGRPGAEHVLRAFVHQPILCRLQGDGVDGERLQERARGESELGYTDYQGDHDRDGARSCCERLLRLLGDNWHHL